MTGPFRMAHANPRIECLAARIALQDGVVTSSRLALSAEISIATASAKLALYATRYGILERIGRSGHAYEYHITDRGREWLASRCPPARVLPPDCGPLLAALGYGLP